MSNSRYLTPKEEARIRHAINDGIMHFSPTISPAPKRVASGEIESIFAAAEYYRNAGEKTLIMQPKYMGSYCDVYLCRNIEDTKLFSRKGFTVPVRVDRGKLLNALMPLWHRIFDNDDDQNLEKIIIQSELMPWSALGKGLIERDFRGYQECHQTHCDYIKNSPIINDVMQIKSSNEYQQFLVDMSILNKKELNAKYPQHIIGQYDAITNLLLPETDSYQNSIDLYKEQVDIYGAEGETSFKPFNWLKKIYSDGSETLNEDNISGFRYVSDDENIIIDISGSDESFNDSVSNAYLTYSRWVELNMEGAVIKPQTVWLKEFAPMFKVRNKKYLQMIYGIKFNTDYQYYLEKRGIKKKMLCSINQWNIAQSLLRIPEKNINKQNDEYVRIVTARILEEDFEATLDSRL